MTANYRFWRKVGIGLLAVLHPVRLEGKRGLPEGKLIVVANHKSNRDAIVVATILDRQVHFMAKQELFKNKLLGKFVSSLGAFPVDRGNADMNAIRKSMEILESGGVLGIFPQGTRVRDNNSFEVQTGVAMIAMRAKAQILPVHIVSDYHVFRPLRVVIGEPIEACPEGVRPNGATMKALCEKISESVLALK